MMAPSSRTRSRGRRRRLPPLTLAAALLALPHSRRRAAADAATPAELLDEALLTDLLSSYATHVPSACNSSDPDLHNRTTFAFSFPGTRRESGWDPDAAGFEEALFQASMGHADDDPARSWEFRFGTGGNIYSAFVHGMEAMSPQTYNYDYSAPWVDEVDQIVSVNTRVRDGVNLPYYSCGGSRECAPYFVHQAGAYGSDPPTLRRGAKPFHSPSLARHCAGNSCAFASWGTQAHVPTPYRSPVIFVTKFTNCGGGVVEHTQMIHNFANPANTRPLLVDQDFFNVGWSGVRTTSLPFALEPTARGVLNYGSADNVDNVGYLPLCRWGIDLQADQAGRAVAQNINRLGGYTTFVGDGLILNRSAQVKPACRKPNTSCGGSAASTCMVETCTTNDVNNGYTRVPLGVRTTGPQCVVHRSANPYGGYVALKCNLLLNRGFGKTRPYISDPDPCAPWRDSRIGFRNSRTGATLEVSYVRHWSWDPSTFQVFFSTFIKDTGSAARSKAVRLVNNMFAARDRDYPIELRTVYMSPVKPWCRKPTGCSPGSDPTCMVPDCTDEMIRNEGYTQMDLAVPTDGPGCEFYETENPFQGLVTLKCLLRRFAGFGLTDVEEHPPIGFYNTVTGKTLRVMNVKHWSLYDNNRYVYFSVDLPDDGPEGVNRNRAIAQANNLLANNSNRFIPIEIRSLSENGFDDVPESYDPASLPAFTHVYGKGEAYDSGVAGWSRRRIGSSVDTRQFTVFTINWLGSAKLRAGDSYVNRVFKVTSDLGSVQQTARNLVSKTYIDEIGMEQWTPRKVDIYQDNSRFVVVAATLADPDRTTCAALSEPVCSGTSTPKSGSSPFFHVMCGGDSYLGPDPYHFTPPFEYCVKVKTGSAEGNAGNVRVFTNSNDGRGYVRADPKKSKYDANEVVVNQCFSDLIGVQIAAPTCSNDASCDDGNACTADTCTADGVCQNEQVPGCALVVGGSSGGRWSGPRVQVADEADLHEVRCCSDTIKAGWAKNSGCSVWGASSVPVCNADKNFTEAKDICALEGARLCTPTEIKADCTKGTGCNFDHKHVWTAEDDGGAGGWVGTVKVSLDHKASYYSLPCDSCDGERKDVDTIAVDTSWTNSLASTNCVNRTCTLPFRLPYCILIQTSEEDYSRGTLDVWIDSGNGFEQVAAGDIYEEGEVVLDRCYGTRALRVRVKNPTENAWVGDILVSTDEKKTYSSLRCDDCSGSTAVASPIGVHGVGGVGSTATTKCDNGNECTLSFLSRDAPAPVCVRITTGSNAGDSGTLGVFVNSKNGKGFFKVSRNKIYSENERVVDQCFADLVAIRVKGSNNDSWIGTVLVSRDGGPYLPMECDHGCAGTTDSIVVGGYGTGSSVTTQCLNGSTCGLRFNLLCLLITTDTSAGSTGNAIFSVDSGNGFAEVARGQHYKGTVVLDRCYTHIAGIRVKGQAAKRDSWKGSILLSSNNKVSYHPLECQGCTGKKSTSLMVVDNNGRTDSNAPTHCLHGKSCLISVHTPTNDNFVRSYACKNKGISVRPTWKLMGFFPNDSGCRSLSGSTYYDESACSLFERN